jgi:DNA-binding HxlR family transcriptional regulator
MKLWNESEWKASFVVRSDIERVLPDEYTGAREIHASVGRWARKTIRHGLADLVEQGIVEVIHDDSYGAGRHLYRRKRRPSRLKRLLSAFIRVWRLCCCCLRLSWNGHLLRQ